MDGKGGCGCGTSSKQSFGPQQPLQPPIDIPRCSMQLPPRSSGDANDGSCEGPLDHTGSAADRGKADRLQEKLEKEKREAELSQWVSPLRMFDSFASTELKRRDALEEDYPRLKVPQLKGQHRCRVSCLLNHSVDYAIDMEQELRNIGIQETQMMDMLEKLTRAESAVRFQGAVRAAEVAAMSAPPELAEEAAVAGARGYTVETQEFSKSSKPGENPIEIVGYIGCTRPNNF